RQVDEKTSGAVLIPGRADVVHQLTVIARGEHVGDLVFEVESLAEDQRRQRTSEAPPAGGVAGSTGDSPSWIRGGSRPLAHFPGDRRQLVEPGEGHRSLTL